MAQVLHLHAAGKGSSALHEDKGVPVSDDVRRPMATGLAAVLLLVGGLGGWAIFSTLAGAVIAPGTVVVDSHVKKVQHLSGGIVAEIRIRDGDRVRPGDLLIRLDDTLVRANLQIIVGQLDELAVRQARLAAERDGTPAMPVPPALAARAGEPELGAMLAAERTLFDSRRVARDGQKDQLGQRIGQLRQQIAGIEAQLKAKDEELRLVKIELAAQEALWRQKLTPLAKFTETQREAVRLAGERGQLVAAAAQARTRMGETELQIIQIDQELRAEVMKELRDIQAKQAELQERRVAAEDQLKRIDIRSPQAGVVHQLAMHTVGGVVNQGEPLMLIVPENDVLVVEVKVMPQDIDQVRPGQKARVRFPAFNQNTTPEFEGEVARISADLTREPQLNQTYYVARIALPTTGRQLPGGATLLPGMPAEVHVQSGERSALSYLVKPLSDQIARAFTER